MKDPDTELRLVDYERIGRVFDYCEEALLRLAAERRLLGMRIERWRWDVPDIAMSWTEPVRFGKIHKNLRVLISKRGESDYQYTIDINAWSDNRGYAGIATERLWNNQSYELVPSSQEKDYESPKALIDAMKEQFEIVMSWNMDSLKRHHLFSESTR